MIAPGNTLVAPPIKTNAESGEKQGKTPPQANRRAHPNNNKRSLDKQENLVEVPLGEARKSHHTHHTGRLKHFLRAECNATQGVIKKALIPYQKQ
jgi:hypothetical protein